MPDILDSTQDPAASAQGGHADDTAPAGGASLVDTLTASSGDPLSLQQKDIVSEPAPASRTDEAVPSESHAPESTGFPNEPAPVAPAHEAANADNLIIPASGGSGIEEMPTSGRDENKPVPSEPPPVSNTSGPKSKKKTPAAMIAVVLLLLITLPIAVLFVSQQRQIADQRSRAGVDTGGPGSGLYPPGGSTPTTYASRQDWLNCIKEGGTTEYCNRTFPTPPLTSTPRFTPTPATAVDTCYRVNRCDSVQNFAEQRDCRNICQTNPYQTIGHIIVNDPAQQTYANCIIVNRCDSVQNLAERRDCETQCRNNPSGVINTLAPSFCIAPTRWDATTRRCVGANVTTNNCPSSTSGHYTGSGFDNSRLAAGCKVYHYHCPWINGGGRSCDDRGNGAIIGTGGVQNFNQNCGTEQIDVQCPATTSQCSGADLTQIRTAQEVANQHRILWVSRDSGVECRGGGGGGTPTPPPPTRPPSSSPTPTRVNTPTPTRVNTPTPTLPPIISQCNSIKIYKNGQVVSNPSTLRPGDRVVLAVAGGNATKGRIRVNGGAFTETTTKNTAGEYIVNYTIAQNVTRFVIEAEIFGRDNIWH